MKKLKECVMRVLRMRFMKYAVVLALGVVFVGFLDDNSVWAHMRNKRRIAQLEREIARYEGDYRRDQARIRLLQTSPKAMEKIARERYFMKTADEEIFVLSDDEAPAQTNDMADETVE